MTNKDFLNDDMFADARFPERDAMLPGRYVPYDFAVMYPSGVLPL